MKGIPNTGYVLTLWSKLVWILLILNDQSRFSMRAFLNVRLNPLSLSSSSPRRECTSGNIEEELLIHISAYNGSLDLDTFNWSLNLNTSKVKTFSFLFFSLCQFPAKFQISWLFWFSCSGFSRINKLIKFIFQFFKNYHQSILKYFTHEIEMT